MKTKPTLKLVIFLLLPLSLIPILSGWIGDIIREWMTKETQLSWIDCLLLIVAVIIIPMLAYFIINNGKKYLPVQKIKQSDDVPMRKVVIAMLSSINEPLQLVPPMDDGEPSAWVIKNSQKEISLLGLTLKDVIHKDTDMLRLPWQQTLRAAYQHKDKLEKLVLIGSSDDEGSGKQLDLAHQFFTHYFPGKVKIMGANENDTDFDVQWQADFESLDDLRELLAKTLKELQKEYKQKDMIFDCTGGQKTASIASVLMTLDKPDLACQYVRTFGDNVGKVLGFNAITEPRGV